MIRQGALDKLRSDYPDSVAFIDSQPLWGFSFRIGQPLGHVALEAVEKSLGEELEIAAFELENVEGGVIPAHSVLNMLVRGISAQAANQHAVRVIAPRFGPDRIVESPIVSVQPLLPEETTALFAQPDVRIPDITDEFSAMMNPTIL